MIRLIKYDLIKEKEKNILKKLNDLIDARVVLESNIREIINYYKGKDSYLLVSSYLSKVKAIDMYIKNVTKYLNYFEWLSGKYGECYDKNLKDIEKFIFDSIQNVDLLPFDWGEL